MNNFPVTVLDFETTGLSPRYGDRAIEIGAVLIENNMVTDRFQSLMIVPESNLCIQCAGNKMGQDLFSQKIE